MFQLGGDRSVVIKRVTSYISNKGPEYSTYGVNVLLKCGASILYCILGPCVVDMSVKTPVARRFAEATATVESAAASHEAAATRLQDVLTRVKRTSGELRFRGQEREQLAAMASLGADMLVAFQSAIGADRVVLSAARAAADEADRRIDDVEGRLVRERAARNRAAAEFARVAVETRVGRGGGGDDGGSGGGGVEDASR